MRARRCAAMSRRSPSARHRRSWSARSILKRTAISSTSSRRRSRTSAWLKRPPSRGPTPKRLSKKPRATSVWRNGPRRCTPPPRPCAIRACTSCSADPRVERRGSGAVRHGRYRSGSSMSTAKTSSACWRKITAWAFCRKSRRCSMNYKDEAESVIDVTVTSAAPIDSAQQAGAFARLWSASSSARCACTAQTDSGIDRRRRVARRRYGHRWFPAQSAQTHRVRADGLNEKYC